MTDEGITDDVNTRRSEHSEENGENVLVGGSLESPKWLIDGFCPKILGPWWGPTKVFCGYVNGHWVGILLPGGGDT